MNKPKKTKAVIVKTEGTSPATLLELAVKQDVDVEKLEKLMAMQERWNDQQAKKAYLEAMSNFQNKCPVLVKNKTVKFNQTIYSYVPLGDIVKQIKRLLNECNLSFRWDSNDKDGLITVICIVSHIDGHSEQNSMSAGKDKSGSKNEIQQIGSTMTYLQRYTLIGALGISTADSDMDGQEAKEPTQEKALKKSPEILIQAKILIDEYESAEELQTNGRKLIQAVVKEGLNKKDRLILATYVSNKYETLKL